MSEDSVAVIDSKTLLAMFGPRDQHLKKIRAAFGIEISVRGNQLHVLGDEQLVAKARAALLRLQNTAERQGALASEDVDRVLAESGIGYKVQRPALEVMLTGRQIRARTEGQERYLAAIESHEITFCVGPAGTGKTYLAVAAAVSALRENRIRRIVLVRPAVEAGESLGFLPGDLAAKINPYLRPLLDSLRDMIDPELMKRYQEQEVIEVIPLAYMRGRTLNEAFIILDEAQNATVLQMKMFLTRMGQSSRIVVCGDTTQSDLPERTRSGLNDALERLQGISSIGVVRLSREDIVRHRLVQQILDRYETES